MAFTSCVYSRPRPDHCLLQDRATNIEAIDCAPREEKVMPRQHISYVDVEDMDDAMREEMERCSREGTPRPESSAIRSSSVATSATPSASRAGSGCSASSTTRS